jgi:hypothetical protein
MTVGTFRGTAGYSPEKRAWYDGSFAWDYYSLGAIILESDMTKDCFFAVKTEN